MAAASSDWDDDGNAYLIRSKLRADVLYLHRMSPDGKRLLDNGRVIFHDVGSQPVIEGPKLFKIDGTYYILAPAGGVAKGWQAVLRSKDIYGPYEDKVVLHTGGTKIGLFNVNPNIAQSSGYADFDWFRFGASEDQD